MWTEFILFQVIVGIVLYFIAQRRPHPKYPPGPWGFPILGHLPLLRTDSFGTMMKLKKRFGPVIGLVFGSYRVVVINDYKMIKESMSSMDFSGRPRLRPVCERSGGTPKGIAFTDGHEWIEKRRFALKHLRDFGFGKKSMESIVQEEIIELIEHFKRDVGVPTSTINRFNAAILNALWQIISGQRFRQDDPKLLEILKLVNSTFPAADSAASLSTLMPFLSYIGPNLFGFNQMMAQAFRIVDFVREFTTMHKEGHVIGQPRGFLDVYFDEIANAKPGSGFYGKEGEHSMLYVLVDLFSAGAETTSTSLTNIFLYMALNPECQSVMHAEIDRVVGPYRLPSLGDRSLMPYTEAVIHEVLRLCPLISVMHRTLVDIPDFHGYFIPKDTIVMPDIYAAQHDPDFWDEPKKFDPTRFISKDGTQVLKKDAFMPFSVGKRICPAETLARDELFLFTASLFQKFVVAPDPANPHPSTELIIKTVISPKPHKILLTERKVGGN